MIQTKIDKWKNKFSCTKSQKYLGFINTPTNSVENNMVKIGRFPPKNIVLNVETTSTIKENCLSPLIPRWYIPGERTSKIDPKQNAIPIIKNPNLFFPYLQASLSYFSLF